MDEIRHKCGYCGWLFRFTTNFTDHECFKNYIEDVDRINIDENYVVTIVENNPTVVGKENLNELLIEAVRSKRGLYDFRHVPASERTTLRKNALWMEVSNILRGSLSPEEAKARWKYLRDNYIKARKKVRAYIPSGSAATVANTNFKSRFQYYELMRFLDDSLQTRPTVSSLTDANESEVVTSLDTQNEQHESDAIAGSSTLQETSKFQLRHFKISTSAINKSPQTHASPYVPSRTPTSTNTSPRSLDSIDVLSQTPTPTKDFPLTSTTNRVPTRPRTTRSKQSVQIVDSIDVYEPPVAKKKKNDAALQEALIEAIRSGNEPATQPIDPLDGFLIRLGEGMRKLPYRNRAKLEIQFLTLLGEMEDRCFNQDSDDRDQRNCSKGMFENVR
ncbi:uncharacterized protein LOC112451568 [Temnothorax curvispinosus]|uniref:Uncharacterized protein LOC112451568 n=1 Tax=Temnothorax curvispinosus TaxID=300111 RepID=A0A6J1PBU3_9HYME|nr:uncharacterized protein LOC112451568 [Temnothorax curvispinosus]